MLNLEDLNEAQPSRESSLTLRRVVGNQHILYLMDPVTKRVTEHFGKARTGGEDCPDGYDAEYRLYTD